MVASVGLIYTLGILTVLLAFAFAVYLTVWVRQQKNENKTIERVAGLIREGAVAFMRKEYLILAAFSGVMAILIFLFLPHPVWKQAGIGDNLKMAVCYLAGAAFSAIAGRIGIFVAALANARCAEAATQGIKPAFLIGFRGGAVMGLIVVASCLLGVMGVMAWVGDPSMLLGFSFGASSLALFAKAGGGIFTKTADVSADLAGKVELGIPEDDPRNPAVIADNVGDNVGDVAGMGADLFDSNIASMSAAIVMAYTLDGRMMGANVMMVFVYAVLGLLSSIVGIWFAKASDEGGPTRALNNSTYITTGVFLVLTALATLIFRGFRWEIWGASAVGLLVGVVIGLATDYFTDDSRPIVRKVARASETGPEYAMFGISMAAVGMLSIVGMIISNDAYGPIVDNARGLAEMGGLGEETIRVADELDSAGNTVKAVTKGFAIGAAGLTVIALLGAFMDEVNTAIADINAAAGSVVREALTGFNLMDPTVFFGILVGAAIPAVFSAMLILGVDKNAQRMIAEIHRQFREIKGLSEGRPDAQPDYKRCIDIATTGALKELIPAGLVAILATILVGFVGGVNAIGGFLLGNIVTGLLLALFMSNAGGLWDNGKKYVESGHSGGKGSDAHKAAVIGDTVGDPFKDTAGPSINTQITVVSLVASLLATVFLRLSIF